MNDVVILYGDNSGGEGQIQWFYQSYIFDHNPYCIITLLSRKGWHILI
jgi:hypothetical protein